MKIRGFGLVLLPLAALNLSGCATGPDMTGWSPEQIAAYRMAEAQQMQALSNQLAQTNASLAQQNQALMSQINRNNQAPVVNPVGSQDQTVVAYCKQTSSYTTHCRIKQ